MTKKHEHCWHDFQYTEFGQTNGRFCCFENTIQVLAWNDPLVGGQSWTTAEHSLQYWKSLFQKPNTP